jgi:hypothetical protein
MTRHLSLALLLLSLPSLAQAQGDASGAIVGYAFDETGNPLAGITITVQSPTQIGGPRKTTTSAEGFFRLAALFPGVFRLRAQAAKMIPYVQEGIQVGLGTVEITAILSVATAGSDVLVVLDHPVVQPDSAKVTKVFDTRFVEVLPMRSRDQVHTQLIDQVPGGMNGRLRGSNQNQILFLQDGFELNQSNGVYPVLKSAAAFEVGVSGYGADGATAPGGMLNVVTRSGSNKLEAELEATADSSRLRFFTDQRDASAPSFYYLLAPLLSGPILKDRLWFMVTDELHFIQNARSPDAEGLLPAADTYRKFIHKGTLKLTWQVSTRHRLSSVTNLEFPIWEHNMTAALGTESDAQQDRYARRLFTGLVYDALLADSLVLRSQAGLMQIPQEWYPTRCRRDPDCDFVPSVVQNLPRKQALQNNPSHRRDDLFSVQWANALSWFGQRPGLGQHDLVLKDRFYTEENTQRTSRPGDRTYELNGSTPAALTTYYANDPRYEEPRYGWFISTAHVLRHTTTLSDGWKPSHDLTITPSLSHTFAGGWNSRGDRLVNSQALAPGLALAWDPTHDGRTVVRASHSQYVDVDLLAAARHTLGSQAQQRCLWNADTQGYDRACVFSGGLSRNTFGSPCGPSGLDTEGRPCREPLGIPRTYEYGLGVERDVGQGVALSLDLAHRRYAHQFEVSETNRVWSDSGNTVVGYRNGRPEAILDLGTPAAATRQYTGVTFGITRREGRLKTMASYTWSTLTGNVFDNLNNPWGDIPARDVYLRGGPLADDHRHEVRATWQYEVCRMLTLGGRYEFSSGTPVQRLFWNEETAGYDLYRARPGQNAGTNLNDPGDDRPLRLPDHQELNVEVRANLLPLLGQKLEVAVDFLNVLGQRTATALGQNDGQDVGVERAWMDPFRIRLRVNYRY